MFEKKKGKSRRRSRPEKSLEKAEKSPEKRLKVDNKAVGKVQKEAKS
jgi:hypothetical protein